MLHLISYDIEDDRQRTRAHKLLTGHGQRVQYSVFECWLAPEDLERLRERLAPLLGGQFDSIRIYRLCESCRPQVEVIGWGDPPEEEENWVV